MISRNAGLVRDLKAGLAEVLPARGFTVSDPMDPRWGVWFRKELDAVPHAVSAITAGFGKDRYGGVAMAGYVSIRSAAVNEVLLDLPEEAWLKREREEVRRFGPIDTAGFGDFLDPPKELERVVVRAEQVAEAVNWFAGFVSGPAAEWLLARDSLDKLIGIAQTPSPHAPDNINPVTFRGVVALCIVNSRFGDAAYLMDWYLDRGRFNFRDSLEKSTAMDRALAVRFPEYGSARAGMR